MANWLDSIDTAQPWLSSGQLSPGGSGHPLVVGGGPLHGVQRLDDFGHLGQLDGAAAVLVVHLEQPPIEIEVITFREIAKLSAWLDKCQMI